VYLPVIAASQGDLNAPEAITSRGWIWISILGRLKAGTTPTAAAAAGTVAIRNGARAAHSRDSTVSVLLGPIQEARGTGESDDAKVSAWIAGVSLIVLLIACANTGNLLLARGVSRRRELAVRASLGAGRGGLLRMLLIESAVLATGGGALAILLAVWGGGIGRQLLLPELPATLPVVDGRVLWFTFLAVIGTVFLVGAIPAWHASRANLVNALKQGGHGSTAGGGKTRTALLIAQIALTLTLLVGAGLFVRSLRNAKQIDMGLDAPHLMSVTISRQGRDRLESNAAYFDLGNRLQQLPGVVSVAASMGTPFRWAFADPLRAEGVDTMPRNEGGGPYFQAVTPAYLATMGTRIAQGRDLNDGDREGTARVAVIGAYFASRLWPGASPLGKCIYIGTDAKECTTIVGVAADAKRGQLTEESSFLYYIPFAQRLNPDVSEIFVRTRGPAEGMVAAVTREARRSSTLPFVDVEPFMARVTPQLWSWQLGAMAFTAFGALALLIAATGIFAVLSYSVSQRTKEVGLRVALGAQQGDVVRLVVGQGVRAALAGVAIGCVGGWALAHAMSGLLYKVAPTDAATLIMAPLVLLAVATLAAYLPARRAARVDPMVALRAE
jgi:predicted permease